REHAWEHERNQLLTQVREREELADKQLTSLSELRQRWAKRRRQELEQLQADRAALETVGREHHRLRLEVTERAAAQAAEKRVLAEKILALEQFRQEFLAKTGNPNSVRRIERLRRRWLTQNAAAIRGAARERAALGQEILELQDRHADL